MKMIFILRSIGITPKNISFKDTMYFYKPYQDYDIYPEVYVNNLDIEEISLGENIPLILSNHVPSWFSVNQSYKQVIEKYFNPSNKVKLYQTFLKYKYSIDFENTIALYYRGTDKLMETNLYHPQKYVDIVKKILEKKPNFRVLIQTDQTQVKEYIKQKLGDICFFFDEIPTTSDCHLKTEGSKWHITTKNLRFSTRPYFFDAVVRTMSLCKYIVCGSSNVSLMMFLYRKNFTGMYVFCGEYDGGLVFKKDNIHYKKDLITNKISQYYKKNNKLYVYTEDDGEREVDQIDYWHT